MQIQYEHNRSSKRVEYNKNTLQIRNIDSEYNINNENGQIFLLVGNSCPWCQRTLIVHEIKDLSKKVKVIFLKADIEHGEWIFNTKIKGCTRLSDLYKKAYNKIIFRATLPLLISFVKDEVNILSNESSQIIRQLNAIKNDSNFTKFLIFIVELSGKKLVFNFPFLIFLLYFLANL